MNPLKQNGVFDDKGFLWTKNSVPGQKVYGERLRAYRGGEYRDWNPHRSKMAALLRLLPDTPWMDPGKDMLYLGASSGTTVSHMADVLRPEALLYAVEFSPRSVRDLLWNVESRQNVVPILDDAGKPERYSAYIDRPVGALVQDVAQRHQVDIFLRNLPFLAKDGVGYLFVKARSIDVAKPVRDIFEDVERTLKANGVRVVGSVDMDPFHKEHRALVVRP